MKKKSKKKDKNIVIEIRDKDRFVPFSNKKENEKINTSLQFFMYFAPTIESKLSIPIKKNMMDNCFQEMMLNRHFEGRFVNFSTNFNKTDNILLSNNICDNNKRYICKKKSENETDLECFLRHIRNSIAHGNVFMFKIKKSRYYVFDDFNKNCNISAKIICLNEDLESWRNTIKKFQKQ